jgi:xanthine dehydrogenase accessory factor
VELWFERFDARDRAFVAEVLAFRDANPAAVLVTRLSAREPSRRIEAVAPAETPGYLIERLKAAATPLYLYGAGHVGRALVAILATLPSKVTWIDSREEPFPSAIPAGVEARECESPAEVATEAPPDAIHVVMSHSHALDYEIVRAVLRRGEFAWLGLIGSETKALRFRQRLRAEGLAVDRLVCPIGVSGITSKLPAAIAVAVGAQVLRELEVSQGSVRTTLAQR